VAPRVIHSRLRCAVNLGLTKVEVNPAAALLALAHAWESRSLTRRGFELEFDPTLLDCARELRGVLAVVALLDFVGRCRG
jgi:hypothetical protein